MTPPYNPKILLSNPTTPTQSIGLGYDAIGVINPHYATALTETSGSTNESASSWSNLNALDRLNGVFIDVLAQAHVALEIPAIKVRVQDSITKQTVDGYINHIKAAGDNILAALGTMRTTYQGNAKATHTNELFQACSQHNLTSNISVTNTSFGYHSAKQIVQTVGLWNQTTDLWQGASKYVWWRSEKHFQIQAATLGFYASEAIEEHFKQHYESSVQRTTRGNQWHIEVHAPTQTQTQSPPPNPSVYWDVEKDYLIQSKLIQLKAQEDLLVQARDAYVEARNLYIKTTQSLQIAAQEAQITAKGTLTLGGSQIFLSTGFTANPQSKAPEPMPTLEEPKPADPTTLPFYAKAPLTPNRPGSVTVVGNQTLQNPTI